MLKNGKTQELFIHGAIVEYRQEFFIKMQIQVRILALGVNLILGWTGVM